MNNILKCFVFIYVDNRLFLTLDISAIAAKHFRRKYGKSFRPSYVTPISAITSKFGRSNGVRGG